MWVDYNVTHRDATSEPGRVPARWQRNDPNGSYWHAYLGPFRVGDRVTYTPWATSPAGDAAAPTASFQVAPPLQLALLWHQHQPLYRDPEHPSPRGSYLQPWVRLHALRDYYAMAALVADHPGVHLTINLTPVLLEQLEDYLERGATDQALELTLTPAETLTASQREELLERFFDADWHHQIYPHPRYRELLDQRQAERPFTPQDLRDLQMWFNLAWFAPEFRQSDVPLTTGATVSVRRFVQQQRDFRHDDLTAMVAEQYKILTAIVPIHRRLQDDGQIEIATSPHYHPILPLIIDTDSATIDRPGATHPPRFAYPNDAHAHIHAAIERYRKHFGRPPRGMWPAEGAVSPDAATLFTEAGLDWIASDRGVLERSGRWGYRADDPNVLCQPYRLDTPAGAITIVFRDTGLSDDIGFHYQAYTSPDAAATDFLRHIRERFASRLDERANHVLTIILDGENAWSAYPNDARPFLHALYRELERAHDLITVTLSESLYGNPQRALQGQPLATQTPLYELYTASWIDENGSAPGVDLGTWIGEQEENAAWLLLLAARQALERSGATPHTHPQAYQALYAAEGSDWFWWYGDDQDSGTDADFDDLYRKHLTAVYRHLDLTPPPELDRHIVPRTIPWTFTRPPRTLQPHDRLTIHTHCPGRLSWSVDDGAPSEANLQPTGGVMAAIRRHQLTLGPFPDAHTLRFRFHCTHPGCDRTGPCCRDDEHRLTIQAPPP